jgi:hypothetical protein
MAEAQSRADEVARVRGYLTAMAAKWSPAEIVEKVRESQAAVMAAAQAVPADRFTTPPAGGEWSAAEVLYHVLTVIGDSSRAVISTIQTGTPTRVRPDQLEHINTSVTLDEALELLAAERQELFEAVASADPNAHLDVIVGKHPEFGAFNWREALLFVRVHDLDHARQIEAIAKAV